MARKFLTREVTKTTVKIGKIEYVDGKMNPIELPDEIMLGNKTVAQAQKFVNKKYAEPVNVLQVQAETKVYEMAIEEFIKLASVKEPKQEENEQQ